MNFFINPIINNKLGYDIYKFFIFNKKHYELNNLKKNGNLIIYNGYFPYDALFYYCYHNSFKKEIDFLINDCQKHYEFNKKFIHKIDKIYFFYPFSYFDKNEYKINILKILKDLLYDKFKKEIIFIMNNFHYPNNIEYKNFNAFEFDCYNNSYKNFYQNEEKRDKIFISLNSKKRKHRVDLYNFLKKNDLLKHFYCSFIEENILLHDIGDKKVFFEDYYDNKKIHYSGHKAFNNILKDDLYTINNKIYFQKSFYYLITETSTSENVLFLSEKTYKAFYHKIPFILIGNPNSLNFLHQQGFKTFSPYIDESYDLEKDYKKRKQKIYNEIIRLTNLSLKDHIEINHILKDVVNYNFNHYYQNYDHRFKKEFFSLF